MLEKLENALSNIASHTEKHIACHLHQLKVKFMKSATIHRYVLAGAT